MAHLFTPGTGFFVRQPSWHRLEKVVLEDWPGDWATARDHAGLVWEPESVPVYELQPQGVGMEAPEGWTANPIALPPQAAVVPGYQRIIRSDNRLTLGIQSEAYRIITNAEFGYVIESVLGADFDAELLYEGVFELDKGRKVVAVVRLAQPVVVPGDNSETFTYAVFFTRHDGSGGLRVLLTNVRVVCANTAKAAEAGAKEEETAFTIRHTSNWDERVAEVRDKLADALKSNQRYYEICEALATRKVSPSAMNKMVARFLPIGDDMGIRQQQNRENERAVVRSLIEGPTVSDEHRRTPYGFLQAATEWSDHHRRAHTESSYVTRQLLSREPMKMRAFGIAKRHAGVR